MDLRWRATSRDSKKDVRIILHPTAAFHEIRNGLDPGSDDSVDLSPYVTQATQTAFDASVTLSFNRELFGPAQPAPNQLLEIQLWQKDEWKPIWIGIIDNLSSFTLQRGTRSVQLSAKSRDSQDLWRKSKRVTALFPQLTDFTYIAMRVARDAGLRGDEIVFPASAMTTAHSNTQMADMNAWDMISAIFQPLGWTPFIDGIGRLRAADRSLQGRSSDIRLTDDRVIKIGGQRQRSPVSRVRVQWLNPTLKKHTLQQKKLTERVITLGWWLPYWKDTFYFSDDQTQRAENTYFVGNPRCQPSWLPFNLVDEDYKQQSENQGRLTFDNHKQTVGVISMIAGWHAAHYVPDTVPGTGVTVPVGRIKEAFWQIGLMGLMIMVGTGKYEIWGTPFDWVHARNTSEAFDSSVPLWVDNVVDIESDFIVNEEHAKAVAVRELIYQARSANKWSTTIVDDPRIEYGDILQFTDGTQLYVEDFTRQLERGSEATLDVTGFLVGPTAGTGTKNIAPVAPGAGGGGGGGAAAGEEGPLGVPIIGKQLWIGWFEFTTGTPPAPLGPGNCSLWVHHVPWALNAFEIQEPDQRQFAQWIQGSDVADIEAQVAAETEPAVAYWDARVWPSWPTLRAGDWICLQAYCHADESPAQFETAMTALIDSVPSGYTNICLVCQCYTSNTGNTTNLSGIVPVYARLARDNARVTMMLVFSDQGRATGLADHPDVRPYWQELFDGASPGASTGGGGGTGTGSPGGPSTIPNYGSAVSAVEAMFNRVIPESQREEGKAQFTRALAWQIHQTDPHIGLFKKTSGAQVMNLSTDIIHQNTDGSYADCCTDPTHADDPSIPVGSVRIDGTWGAHGPDTNTVDITRWVEPTEALANAPGPMTRV